MLMQFFFNLFPPLKKFLQLDVFMSGSVLWNSFFVASLPLLSTFKLFKVISRFYNQELFLSSTAHKRHLQAKEY